MKKTKRSVTPKAAVWFTFVIIAVTAALIIGISCLWTKNEPEDSVAKVNGEPIATDELVMIMEKFRSETALYFYSMYGIDYTAGFWEEEVNGITPADYLKQKALDYIVNIKVQQKQMKKDGVIGDFSYNAFVKRYESENARRQTEINQGGTIYGIEQYTMMDYYDYLFVNDVQLFIDHNANGLFYVSEDEINQFYEKNKEFFLIPQTDEYLELETQRPSIKTELMYQKHGEWSARLVSDAKVVVNEKVYERITIE